MVDFARGYIFLADCSSIRLFGTSFELEINQFCIYFRI
ncbi:hypothetical protein M595_5181 [Lyngbya aestuarii BL J]|uniref:Uncharacterized protein n=1 Tax=Lyngbya aestuarii BL J TaxID=1348334 RepID=U7QDP6_9CYAN|nr:hypothetical protein M595_5181 [Lyngbya aestuarii BL J]